MILSTYSPRELQGIISSGNAVLLKNVKGLGLKTAQKIIVELTGKLTALGAGEGCAVGRRAGGGEIDEALSALVMLGFAARRPKRCCVPSSANLRRPRSRSWCAWLSNVFDGRPLRRRRPLPAAFRSLCFPVLFPVFSRTVSAFSGCFRTAVRRCIFRNRAFGGFALWVNPPAFPVRFLSGFPLLRKRGCAFPVFAFPFSFFLRRHAAEAFFCVCCAKIGLFL